MFDDLEAQFFETALPAYDAFCSSLNTAEAGRNTDLRLGKDAALALFHLREHVPWAKGKKWPSNLAQCSEYVLLQDIVNVCKHAGPRHDGQVVSATDLYEVVVLTEYQDGNGPFHDAEKIVEVQLRDKSVRNLKDILRRVLEMWTEDFKTHGLLQRFKLPSEADRPVPVRSASHGGALLSLDVLAGVRFKPIYRFQRFNYETGQIEAVDMQGVNLKFVVSQPLILTASVTHKATGRKLEASVEVTPDEAAQFAKLGTDSEREEFMNTLATRYRALVDDLVQKGNL